MKNFQLAVIIVVLTVGSSFSLQMMCNNNPMGFVSSENSNIQFWINYPSWNARYLNGNGSVAGDILIIHAWDEASDYWFYHPIDGSPKADYIVAQVLNYIQNKNSTRIAFTFKECNEDPPADLAPIMTTNPVHLILTMYIDSRNP